jgi:hypothetical protein
MKINEKQLLIKGNYDQKDKIRLRLHVWVKISYRKWNLNNLKLNK